MDLSWSLGSIFCESLFTFDLSLKFGLSSGSGGGGGGGEFGGEKFSQGVSVPFFSWPSCFKACGFSFCVLFCSDGRVAVVGFGFILDGDSAWAFLNPGGRSIFSLFDPFPNQGNTMLEGVWEAWRRPEFTVLWPCTCRKIWGLTVRTQLSGYGDLKLNLAKVICSRFTLLLAHNCFNNGEIDRRAHIHPGLESLLWGKDTGLSKRLPEYKIGKQFQGYKMQKQAKPVSIRINTEKMRHAQQKSGTSLVQVSDAKRHPSLIIVPHAKFQSSSTKSQKLQWRE